MELGTAPSDLSLIVQSGERLSQLRPADVDVHWNLGLAHLRLEHPALTVQEMRMFLEYAPDDPRAGEARKLIAELQAAAGDTWGRRGLMAKMDSPASLTVSSRDKWRSAARIDGGRRRKMERGKQ